MTSRHQQPMGSPRSLPPEARGEVPFFGGQTIATRPGKHTKSYGKSEKSPSLTLVGKSTISMGHFR